MKFVTRAEWRARPPRHRTIINTPTPKLYLHHSAGAIMPGDNSVTLADLNRIRSIQNYHMDSRGWSDIAYSFLTDSDGFVFEGRGVGIAGGHTAGQNTVSHAVCVMGHYDIQRPTPLLRAGIIEVVLYGYLKKWWPMTITGGHRDAPGASTSCPGDHLYKEIPIINRMIKETYMAGWQRPGDPVVDKSDIKAVHKWQGNRILTEKDIDYNEVDPAEIDKRWMMVTTRQLSEIMKSL